MSELNDELRQDFKDFDYAHAYVEDFLNSEIATQIKVLREQRGLTQQQLAELAGMAQPRLSLLEDVNYGAWSIKTLKKLAKAFDVTLKVTFEGFESRIGDISNFNRLSLQRKSRMQELDRSVETLPSASVVHLQQWVSQRNGLQQQNPFAGNLQTPDSLEQRMAAR